MSSLLGYAAFFLSLALIHAVICLGLNLQWGFGGLFNVGVAGFVATGAYVDAWVTAAPDPSHWGGFAWPIPLGWLAAMAASAGLALVVGWITLRLRADYLAIATFGAAASLYLVALNAQRLTGGPFGIAQIPRPFASVLANPAAQSGAGLVVIGAVAATAFAAAERLARSPWGRALRALREDEAAAAALGKAPARFRLQAFVLGAALMGLGGAMLAQFFGYIAPDNFLPALTFLVWVMLVLGGSGSNAGAVLGAVLVWALWTFSGTAVAALLPADFQARGASLRLAAVGVALAAVLVWRPRGLLGRDG